MKGICGKTTAVPWEIIFHWFKLSLNIVKIALFFIIIVIDNKSFTIRDNILKI